MMECTQIEIGEVVGPLKNVMQLKIRYFYPDVSILSKSCNYMLNLADVLKVYSLNI